MDGDQGGVDTTPKCRTEGGKEEWNSEKKGGKGGDEM